MMPFLRILLLFVLFSITGSSAPAADSVVDFGSFTLTLPKGYSDHPARGIDSRIGNISIKNQPFKIDYDTEGWGEGPKKFSSFPKEMLDCTIYYERTQDDPVPTCITAWLHPNLPEKPIVTLWVLGMGSFDIQTSGRSEVQNAVALLRSIKIAKSPNSKQ